jgi:Luciferase-like monooxygenase
MACHIVGFASVSAAAATRSRGGEISLAKPRTSASWTLLLPDHFGPQLAPLIALGVAAQATRTLRFGTLVLDNDFRHRAVLAKEAATLDLLSDGRFELGVGTGSRPEDNEQSGIPLDPPAVRYERIVETMRIVKSFFAEDIVTYDGKHYQLSGSRGCPKPVHSRTRRYSWVRAARAWCAWQRRRRTSLESWSQMNPLASVWRWFVAPPAIAMRNWNSTRCTCECRWMETRLRAFQRFRACPAWSVQSQKLSNISSDDATRSKSRISS